MPCREYVAIMKSDLRQQYPSQLAIVAYLRQSPGAARLDLPPTAAPSASCGFAIGHGAGDAAMTFSESVRAHPPLCFGVLSREK